MKREKSKSCAMKRITRRRPKRIIVVVGFRNFVAVAWLRILFGLQSRQH
jgi:hypothetical protein